MSSYICRYNWSHKVTHRGQNHQHALHEWPWPDPADQMSIQASWPWSSRDVRGPSYSPSCVQSTHELESKDWEMEPLHHKRPSSAHINPESDFNLIISLFYFFNPTFICHLLNSVLNSALETKSSVDCKMRIEEDCPCKAKGSYSTQMEQCIKRRGTYWSSFGRTGEQQACKAN